MIMANLIKRIAVSTARKTGKADIAKGFQSNSSNTSSRRQSGTVTQQDRKCGQFHELESVASLATDSKFDAFIVQVTPVSNQIKQTTEVVISRESESADFMDRCGPEIKITGGQRDTTISGDRRKSTASTTHATRNSKDADSTRKHSEASGDGATLVGQNKWLWN